jgi:hypothetical protein
MGPSRSDEAVTGERPPKPTMKERAKAARHEAYQAAKERRKNDPRTAELKARMKAARREASAQAKERRKNDPKQIAHKEKLKQDRRAASEKRRTERGAARTAERAQKDDLRRLKTATAERGATLALVQGNLEVVAPTATRAQALASLRAALTLIEGGKSKKTDG